MSGARQVRTRADARGTVRDALQRRAALGQDPLALAAARYVTLMRMRGSFGATDSEAGTALGIPAFTVGALRSELPAGRVRRTDRRRPLSSGGAAPVWTWAARDRLRDFEELLAFELVRRETLARALAAVKRAEDTREHTRQREGEDEQPGKSSSGGE